MYIIFAEFCLWQVEFCMHYVKIWILNHNREKTLSVCTIISVWGCFLTLLTFNFSFSISLLFYFCTKCTYGQKHIHIYCCISLFIHELHIKAYISGGDSAVTLSVSCTSRGLQVFRYSDVLYMIYIIIHWIDLS